uniref:Hexosyltransferase n=1 Tax=Salvator merianae TaxID=96440 RepID=A0A8D0BPF5_SALMN
MSHQIHTAVIQLPFKKYFLIDLLLVLLLTLVSHLKEKARKLDMSPLKANISKSYLTSNSEACSSQEIFLLILVFSSPGNSSRREVIRETWANVTQVKGYSTRVLFLLGRPPTEATQLEVTNETHRYQDLIQGAFLDSPENQTLKIVKATEWIVTFCSSAKFILKTDEMMFVNLPGLVEYLLNLRTHPEDIYLGRLMHHEAPNRDPQSHSFIPLQKYPEDYYPDHCSTTAFVITQDVAQKIYVTSSEVSILLPPGVFVGLCAQKAGVRPIHSSRFSGKRHIGYNRCCYKFIFTSFVARDSQLLQEWQDLRSSKDCTMLETYYGLVSCKLPKSHNCSILWVQDYPTPFGLFNSLHYT